MMLLENVSLILRPQEDVRHVVLRVILMGESAVWIILPIEISLMDSRGSPSARYKVEIMLLEGQLSEDSPWGLATLTECEVLRMK